MRSQQRKEFKEWTVDTSIEPVVGSIAEFTFGDKYHNKMKIRDLIDKSFDRLVLQ